AGLDDTRQAVEAHGRRCVVIEADLEHAAEARRAGEAALAHFGTIDILVNNAAISRLAPLVEMSVEDWDATLATNLRAPFILAQTLAPKMIEQHSGKIINISSAAGTTALADHAAYSASKGGLNMLTKAMAAEWAQYNIQANAISPTVILKQMGKKAWGDPAKGAPMLAKIPLGRFGKTIEVADLILFLASPASDLICGENILIDGGYTAL
ncbi:MAG: SDR family oxidoreductase, partial [Anaerolineae bacterium]|nr:SDR family oxidoreductase [Anaerolineae bacterium]